MEKIFWVKRFIESHWESFSFFGVDIQSIS